MDTVLMVNTLAKKGCKFVLTRNFKGLEATQEAVQKHHTAVAEGRQRKLILMAIQHEIIPDYTILVTTTYPEEREIEQFGFYHVKKDRANWIPIQYKNRKGKEHDHNWSESYHHTTNCTYLHTDEVLEYIKMVEKQEQLQLVYK